MPKIHYYTRSCQLVADLLATRQTILICQDVANKSATSWQQVVVMEFGKRYDTTHTTDLLRTCYGETSVVDFGLNQTLFLSVLD